MLYPHVNYEGEYYSERFKGFEEINKLPTLVLCIHSLRTLGELLKPLGAFISFCVKWGTEECCDLTEMMRDGRSAFRR